MRKIVVPRSRAGEAGARPSIGASNALCIPEKRPGNLARSPLLVDSRRKKTDHGQISDSSSEPPPPPPQFAPLFFDSCYRTRVQRSPGSSTIKLPTALAESGAYEPDRACHGTLARATVPYQTRLSATVPCHPPLAGHRPLEGHFLPNGTKLALAKRRTGWIPSLTNQTAAASQPTG